MSFDICGPWSRSEAEAFLSDTKIPIRISAVLASGYPVVASLWYQWDSPHIICATAGNAPLARALASNSKCGFEIAYETPPYFGLRGQGDVSVIPDLQKKSLQQLANKYIGETDPALVNWLMNKPQSEVCLKIQPLKIMSYDYRARMAAEHSS